jgi:hypothetical protein
VKDETAWTATDTLYADFTKHAGHAALDKQCFGARMKAEKWETTDPHGKAQMTGFEQTQRRVNGERT